MNFFMFLLFYRYLRNASTTLQSSHISIVYANKVIESDIATLQNVRDNADSIFDRLYLKMASLLEVDELQIPRIVKRQTLRNNTPADGAKEYFKRTVFLELLDGIIVQMRDR